VRVERWALGACLLAAAPALSDVPGAVVVLESFAPAFPDQVPEAAPPRFVLMETGAVYVGGTSEIVAGQLPKSDYKALLNRVDAVRKLPALAGRVEMGPGASRFRLILRRGRPIDMTISGDPQQAGKAYQPLASLLMDLMAFDHESLRPYPAEQFALRTKEGALPGGCRAWHLTEPPSMAAFAPRVVPAAAASGWPTGANPASVCDGDKRYIVSFRPLLPGETP
jgi:hypothetical protein